MQAKTKTSTKTKTTFSNQRLLHDYLQAAGAFDGYGEECEGKDVCIGPIIKVHIVESNDDRSSAMYCGHLTKMDFMMRVMEYDGCIILTAY